VDLTGVVPDRLSAATADAVGGFTVRADGRPSRLGDLFEVRGDASDGTIECIGDFSRVHFVAAGMAWGRIVVRGAVGRHCGERMVGGHIDVEGNAGDWLAAEMSGGEIHIAGAAGDNVASGLAGSESGMSGGLVTIRGNAGHLAGSRMRRGILAIGGDCGEGAGFEMRAGTIVVAGSLAAHAGLGMRRGSILALASAPSLGSGFRRGATWRPPVLPMLLRRLADAGFRPAATTDPGGRSWVQCPWVQWHGDRLAGGRGEVFVAAA
jgi:formylmethanofuran dehydrogenase subunit C